MLDITDLSNETLAALLDGASQGLPAIDAIATNPHICSVSVACIVTETEKALLVSGDFLLPSVGRRWTGDFSGTHWVPKSAVLDDVQHGRDRVLVLRRSFALKLSREVRDSY